MAIRVMHFGLGPIGTAVARQVATRRGFKVVGAVDIDPEKVGRDVGIVAGLKRRLGTKVSSDALTALRRSKPDVVVLCTSSSLRVEWESAQKSYTPLKSIKRSGVSALLACRSLSSPRHKKPGS